MQVSKLSTDHERLSRTSGRIAQDQGASTGDRNPAWRFGNSRQSRQPLHKQDADRLISRLLITLLVRQSSVRLRPGA
jgi:hypothetical protein